MPTPSPLDQALLCSIDLGGRGARKAEYLVLKFEARLGELRHGKLPGRVPTVGSRLWQVLTIVPQLQEIREPMNDHPAGM